MDTVDVDKLRLILDEDDQVKKAIKGTNGTGDPLQYDPHLREERLRKKAKQCGTLAITRDEGESRYVDIIAKLKESTSPKVVSDILSMIKDPVRIDKLFVTGTLEVDEVEAVRRECESLKAATELHLDLFHSVSAIHCDPKSLDSVQGPNGERFPGLDGSGVIVGIVDFGCDFRHRNFRHASGATRIRYLWDQSDRRKKEDRDRDKDRYVADKAGPPKEYGYGLEFNADLINEALRDEDGAYEELGHTPAVATHGTHVMDIAAGNGREPADFGGRPGPTPGELSHPGVAPNAQLIFVHLKTFDQGFLGNSRYLLDAVDYIFKKADELKMPAVVNLSLSSSGGPHDGTTLVEQGLAALVNAKPGRAIVVSAGNGYTKQSHFSGRVSRGKKATILWHTDPRHTDPERTKNEMEIWYSGDRTLDVALYAPGGRKIPGKVGSKETKELFEGTRTNGRRLGRIVHRCHDPNNEDNHVDIRLPHLEGVSEPWRIELSTGGEDVEFHAWIEQDDLGLSRFVDSTADHTVGSISCNDATVSVGAFDTAVRAALALPLEASSAGPTRRTRQGRELERPKPDLSAPGVNIVAARARGGVTVMSGTSMAAPHVTGLIALLFQLGLRAGKGLFPFSKVRELLPCLVDPLSYDEAASNLRAQLGAGRVHGGRAAASVLERPAHSVGVDFVEVRPMKPATIANMQRTMANNGHDNAKTLSILAELLEGQLSNNGDQKLQDLGPIIVFLKEKIQKKEGFRLSIEPLVW